MRIGAALIAPRSALATSDSPMGAGKAATDFAVLVLLTAAALHARELTTVLWLFRDGEISAGLSALLSVLARDLSTPLVMLLLATIALTAAAGSRRDPSRDFDLACISFIPLIFLEALLELLRHLIGPQELLGKGIAWLGYLWAGAILVLAWRQIRRRTL
jgi:hypothetical protein